jgi:hypothetical protein
MKPSTKLLLHFGLLIAALIATSFTFGIGVAIALLR